MSFKTSLSQTADDIDALIDTLIPSTGAVPHIAEAMRYSSLAQGKRLRPFFVRESTKILGGPDQTALRVGVSLELIHCYSLVHDDLPAMDDDDLRRGKPTCHKAFDEATAILAGDGLLTMAFEIIADPATHVDAAIRAELALQLAQAAGKDGMVGGQMLDLAAEAENSHSLDEIIAIQSLKTGALFRFSMIAGAIISRATEHDHTAMRNYADRVGLAFQIADDILDIESSPEQLGKATQKDATAGKATFIDLFGLEEAKKRANELVVQACDDLSIYGDKADVLRAAARFIIDRKS